MQLQFIRGENEITDLNVNGEETDFMKHTPQDLEVFNDNSKMPIENLIKQKKKLHQDDSNNAGMETLIDDEDEDKMKAQREEEKEAER